MAISMMLLPGITGCGNTSQINTQMIEKDSKVQISQEIEQEEGQKGEQAGGQTEEEETGKIIAASLDIYAKAAEENKSDDLEVIRGIVNRLGENGYAAVDSCNQVNMTEADRVIRFCEEVDAKKETELNIIEVTYWNGLIIYDLRTKDGVVDVVKSYYEYKNGNMQKGATVRYQADHWNYTQDGYLLFSGTWFSEEQYMLTLSGTEEYAAFRVQLLEEKCREMNRQYILPAGYKRNNMFIVDWSEEDFRELNFYDLFDLLYAKVYGRQIPYTADDNLGVGAVYQIPKDEFESVIMAYFNIDGRTLQSKTNYCPESAAYEYKPRGFYESELPEFPYPEVMDYTENGDGTITLTVNVVFPYEGISKVYAHEVVVRPLDEGGVQYVSNRVIPSEDNYEETWHTPRLTGEQWEEMYGTAPNS